VADNKGVVVELEEPDDCADGIDGAVADSICCTF